MPIFTKTRNDYELALEALDSCLELSPDFEKAQSAKSKVDAALNKKKESQLKVASHDQSAVDEQLRNLAERANNGDARAYRKLLEKSRPLILNFLTKRLGSNPVCEDICQEVLVAIHKARHTYDPSRPYSPWLFTITKYKYVDYVRRWAKKEGREVVDDALLLNIVKDCNQNDGSHELKEEKLTEALNTLPEKYKEAVRLIKIEGFSVEEASDKLGISQSNLKVTVHRGFKMLKKSWELGHEQ